MAVDKKIKTLELLLKNINSLKYGLCHLAWELHKAKMLSGWDVECIVSYINDSLLDMSAYKTISGYKFPIGEKEPRIKWLKSEIKKLKSFA